MAINYEILKSTVMNIAEEILENEEDSEEFARAVYSYYETLRHKHADKYEEIENPLKKMRWDPEEDDDDDDDDEEEEDNGLYPFDSCFRSLFGMNNDPDMINSGNMMDAFEKGAEALGIPRNKNGEIVAKGENARKLLRYVAGAIDE